MDNVLRWDCVCDACDRAGRYHTIGQGKDSKPSKPGPTGPKWPVLLLFCAVVVLAVLILWAR